MCSCQMLGGSPKRGTGEYTTLLRAPGSECLVRYLMQLPIPVRRPGNHTPHDFLR